MDYNYRDFNFGESAVGDVDRNAGAFIDEISTDLSRFRIGGGKMMVYQGKLYISEIPVEVSLHI